MNTRRLVTDAILIAIYVVLSLYSVNLGFLKLSFAAFPVLVAALRYGWVDGLIVGAMGTFLNQLLTYGLSVTTLMWMLPDMVRGALVGVYAQRRGFKLTLWQTGGAVLASCLVVTALNTLALYVDSLIFHYPTALTAGTIALRFVSSVVMAVIFTIVTPKTVQLLQTASYGKRV